MASRRGNDCWAERGPNESRDSGDYRCLPCLPRPWPSFQPRPHPPAFHLTAVANHLAYTCRVIDEKAAIKSSDTSWRVFLFLTPGTSPALLNGGFGRLRVYLSLAGVVCRRRHCCHFWTLRLRCCFSRRAEQTVLSSAKRS